MERTQEMKFLRVVLSLAFIVLLIDASLAEEPEFSGTRAFEHLKRQCLFGPRVPGTEPHKLTMQYIKEELEKQNIKVYLQEFPVTARLLGKEEVKATNIIGLYNPEIAEKIVLSAHWDTRPIADKDPNPDLQDKPIMGANDGASGVAVLLELARVLNLKKIDKGIVLLFFDVEDLGTIESQDEFRMGSRYFVQHIPEYCPQIIYGINIDLIGEKDLQVVMEGHSYQSSRELLEKFWAVAERNYPAYFPRVVYPPMIDDHLPFIKAGIPYINVIDPVYAYFHTQDDTWDKCSPLSLQIIGNTLLNFLTLK